MRILVMCETSGEVRRAFKAKGHEVWSCDILPADDGDPRHIIGDAFEVFDLLSRDGPIDMVIGHPPCTYLANSGVRWLHTQQGRMRKMAEASIFFNRMLDLPVEKIVLENPIQHKYARDLIRKQDQVIQPWMFGHPESKATCLWLKGVDPLKETDNVRDQYKALPKSEGQRVHMLPPSKDRWKLRSKTYSGIAQAMADQWG